MSSQGERQISESQESKDERAVEGSFSFRCNSARVLFTMISSLYSMKQSETMTISAVPDLGIRLRTNSNASSVQCMALLNKEIFDQFNVIPVDESSPYISLVISTRGILQCLNLYGLKRLSQTFVYCSYSVQSQILRMTLEDKGVLSECEIQTIDTSYDDNEGEDGMDAAMEAQLRFQDHPPVVSLTCRAAVLHRIFRNCFVQSSDEKFVFVFSKTSPQVRVHTKCANGSITYDLNSSSEHFLRYNLNLPEDISALDYSYLSRSFGPIIRAAAVATDCSFKINEVGTLYMVFRVDSTSYLGESTPFDGGSRGRYDAINVLQSKSRDLDQNPKKNCYLAFYVSPCVDEVDDYAHAVTQATQVRTQARSSSSPPAEERSSRRHGSTRSSAAEVVSLEEGVSYSPVVGDDSQSFIGSVDSAALAALRQSHHSSHSPQKRESQKSSQKRDSQRRRLQRVASDSSQSTSQASSQSQLQPTPQSHIQSPPSGVTSSSSKTKKKMIESSLISPPPPQHQLNTPYSALEVGENEDTEGAALAEDVQSAVTPFVARSRISSPQSERVSKGSRRRSVSADADPGPSSAAAGMEEPRGVARSAGNTMDAGSSMIQSEHGNHAEMDILDEDPYSLSFGMGLRSHAESTQATARASAVSRKVWSSAASRSHLLRIPAPHSAATLIRGAVGEDTQPLDDGFVRIDDGYDFEDEELPLDSLDYEI